jgi:hypothetical protein
MESICNTDISWMIITIDTLSHKLQAEVGNEGQGLENRVFSFLVAVTEANAVPASKHL